MFKSIIYHRIFVTTHWYWKQRTYQYFTLMFFDYKCSFSDIIISEYFAKEILKSNFSSTCSFKALNSIVFLTKETKIGKKKLVWNFLMIPGCKARCISQWYYGAIAFWNHKTSFSNKTFFSVYFKHDYVLLSTLDFCQKCLPYIHLYQINIISLVSKQVLWKWWYFEICTIFLIIWSTK